MWFWLNIVYLLFGVACLVHGARARSLKNPFLYFGVGVILSSAEDFLPESAGTLSTTLGALSAIAMVVAAILMFAFAEPTPAKNETKQP